MFIVLLKFSDNKSQANAHMAGHNDWIKRRFADGVFLLIGSLEPGQGGSVIAHNTSHEELEKRLKLDPFVAENVVTAEIIQIAPKRAVERLNFLVD